MASDEKVRTSGEVMRAEASVPVLPVVNPAVEKSSAAQGGVHPAVYIAYVYSGNSLLFMQYHSC